MGGHGVPPLQFVPSYGTTPASASSSNRIFLIPLYSGSISQFSVNAWASLHGPAPVEIELMPCKSAALELLEPALPIGGSNPIARCTASAIFTRFDSRLPGRTAAGDEEITSVFTVSPARFASSSRIVAIFFSKSAITSLLVERRSTVNHASDAFALTTSDPPSIPIFKFDEGLVGTFNS